ncbi:MAG: NAD(P)-dependent oxidoreductase [Spirochaetota bacterium]
MNEIDRKLEDRELSGKPIQVALIGAGQMGTEIIAQVGEMVGMRISVVVDLTVEKAMEGYQASKKKAEIVNAADLKEAEKALKDGKLIATTNYALAVSLPSIEAVIEATGSPEMGAAVALECIRHKKHIIMMNVECDVTVGPLLRQLAENAGVVYSLASGDEPAAIIELCRFAKSLGFRIVAAGKGKNNPLDIYATPDQWLEKAKERKMNCRMLVEFVDGTKTMVEMTAVSNATGLVPDVRGMHGPRVLVKDLSKVFCRRDQGGILTREGVVDFAIGDVHPGVFVVITTDNKKIREGLIQRDMGHGPNYLLFRPFHLCSLEVPLTIARAVFYGESSGHSLYRMSSECIAITKKELPANEVLDGIGEYCCRGSIDTAASAREQNLLPLGLAQGSVLKHAVDKGTALSYDMVTMSGNSVLFHLRKLYDKLISIN